MMNNNDSNPPKPQNPTPASESANSKDLLKKTAIMQQVSSLSRRALSLFFFLIAVDTDAWILSTLTTRSFSKNRTSPLCGQSCTFDSFVQETKEGISRRSLFKSCLVVPIVAGANALSSPTPAQAVDLSTSATADITDRIYITIKGLPNAAAAKRIVIGLFGKDAPNSVAQLKQLVSKQGLPAPCRPRAERALQKEQLEANKVYNSCKEFEDNGVSLDYSTIWRIIKNERIDVGAVTGRFIAREFPEWKENTTSQLKHDVPGVVSVRRGNDGGFGFTIFPGGGKYASQLDEDHVVVGRVLEGMDVVNELNEIPVVTSSKVNYMALTGGTRAATAPDRSCRYGGPMYCNENKPLVKLTIPETGVL